MRVFAAYTLAYFLSYFYRSANAVLGPQLRREIEIDAGELGFMTGAFFLGFALVQPLVGWSLDRWGSRWVTTAGLLVAAAGSAGFATGETYAALIAARLIIGAGMGCVLMGALTSFAYWFETRSYRTASSLLVGLGSLGAVVAASPLAAVAESLGWRWPFAASAVVVLAAAIGIFAIDRATRTSTGQNPDAAESKNQTDQALLRNLDLWTLAGLNVFMSGLLFSVQGLWGGPFLYDTQDASPAMVGRYLTVMSVGAAIGFTSAGTVANRLGVRRATNLGAGVLLASLVGIAFLPPPGLLVAYGVFGVAGAFNILLLMQARFVVPETHKGRAVAFVNLAGIGGGFSLQWLLGVLLDRFPVTAAGSIPKEAYVVALAVCFAGLAAGWLSYARYYDLAGRRKASAAVPES